MLQRTTTKDTFEVESASTKSGETNLQYKILKERAWQKNKTSERDAQKKSKEKTWSKEIPKVFSWDRIFRERVISHRGKGRGEILK